MAIGSYIDLTAQQAKEYKKALRKWQGTKSSIIAKPYRILSREEIKARKSRQWMTEVAAAWKLLDAPTKLIWKTYAANINRTGWSLYMQEYCYRKKYDLSYPPLPHELYQMYGLQISNPTGSGIVKAWRYDIAVTGQINVKVNYKKIEIAETTGLPFRIKAEAFYFYQGQNLSEEQIVDAPAGNVNWAAVDFTFGTAGRYYFELIISFELNDYQADVIIDNFVITDNIGVLLDEPWHIKAGKTWIYQIKTRKMGWEFNQPLGPPYFQIVYTGEAEPSLAYLDPNADVSVEWIPEPVGDHYICVGQGTREPDIPPAGYNIEAPWDSTVIDIFEMETIPEVTEVTQIKIWQYNEAGEGGSGELKININIGGWQVEQDAAIGGWENPEWTSNTFVGSWSQAELNALQVKIKAITSEEGDITVNAIYAEITYN